MKKTFKLYIFTLVISFLGMMSVYAQPSLTIHGGPNINFGQTSNYEIRLNPGGMDVSQVYFRVEIDNIQLFNQPTISTQFSGSGNPTNQYIIHNQLGNLTSGGIATLNLSLREAMDMQLGSRITLSNVEFVLADGTTRVPGTNVTHNLNILRSTTTTTAPQVNQNNAVLRGITLSTGNLHPAFNVDRRDYMISVARNINFLTITPACEGCTHVIELDGIPQTGNRVELESGLNLVRIRTTSANGSNNETYTLRVFRGESAFLTELIVVGFNINPAFTRNQIDFSLSVPYDVLDLDIIATPEVEGARVEIRGHENLQVGDNIVTITVTIDDLPAEYGVRIHNINVTRLEPGEEPDDEYIEEPATEDDEGGLRWGLISIITTGGLIIIGASWFALFGKKKAKTDKKKEEPKEEDNPEAVEGAEESDDLELDTDTNVFDNDVEHTVETALEDLMNTKEILTTDELDVSAIIRRSNETQEENLMK